MSSTDPTPDLLLRSGGHLGAEGGGQLLGPEAHAQDGQVPGHGMVDEISLGCQPRVLGIVVYPHRTAHDHQTTDVFGRRQGIAAEELVYGHLAAGIAQCLGDHPGTLVGHVLEDRPGASRRSGRQRGHYAVFTTWKASASRPSGSPAADAVPAIQPRRSSSRWSPSPTWLRWDLSAFSFCS